MSQHRYLTVRACIKHWNSTNLTLPGNWNEINDEQRALWVKENSIEELRLGGREFERASVQSFEDWEVYSESRNTTYKLEAVVAKPLEYLILEDVYERKEDIDWDHEDGQ